MKNLVKSCRKKLWRAYVFGILSAAIMFLGFSLLVVVDAPGAGILYIILGMTSISCGFAIFAVASDKIMYPVVRRRKEISILRNVHHIRLVDKQIDLGNVVNSESLLVKYDEAKYKTPLMVQYLHGAIRGKFYDKLNIKTTNRHKLNEK
jgi:membrane protein implicated in regulation of membrane protease activity